MAYMLHKDMVEMDCTGTGTGALTLGSALVGRRSFSAAGYTTGQRFQYRVASADSVDWEVGIGSVSGSTVTRLAILASSNADAVVSLPAGTHTIATVFPAASGLAIGSISTVGSARAEVGGAAAGPDATAGTDATAFGPLADATGTNSAAFGTGATATGQQATALGDGAQATATQTVAVGQGATASGDSCTAVGENALASVLGDTAIGNDAYAGGQYSVAVGRNAVADQLADVAVGSAATAGGSLSIAIGSSADARQVRSVAIGQASDANADSAVALGASAEVWSGANGAVALAGGVAKAAYAVALPGATAEKCAVVAQKTSGGGHVLRWAGGKAGANGAVLLIDQGNAEFKLPGTEARAALEVMAVGAATGSSASIAVRITACVYYNGTTTVILGTPVTTVLYDSTAGGATIALAVGAGDTVSVSCNNGLGGVAWTWAADITAAVVPV